MSSTNPEHVNKGKPLKRKPIEIGQISDVFINYYREILSKSLDKDEIEEEYPCREVGQENKSAEPSRKKSGAADALKALFEPK